MDLTDPDGSRDGAMLALRLVPIPLDDLHALAALRMPDGPGSRAHAEALPPAVLAQRWLDQLRIGLPEVWCGGFYMVRARDEHIVGSCGFKDAPHEGHVEIGYSVAPTERNRGYATDAVAELVRLAHATQPGVRVLAQVSADNPASTRVVRKLGFEPRGSLPDRAGEMLVQWVDAGD